jgi:hypothetical protein
MDRNVRAMDLLCGIMLITNTGAWKNIIKIITEMQVRV